LLCATLFPNLPDSYLFLAFPYPMISMEFLKMCGNMYFHILFGISG
jgi:hypothetical protein